jgi:hypothetical protein
MTALYSTGKDILPDRVGYVKTRLLIDCPATSSSAMEQRIVLSNA